MPSLTQIRNLTAIIEIALGGETITIRPLIERISPKDETYSGFIDAENELKDKVRKFLSEFEDASGEVAALIVPVPERMDEFRSKLFEYLTEIGVQVSEESPDIDVVRNACERAIDELTGFELGMVPDEAEMKKRTKKAEAKIKGIGESLEKINEQMRALRLERLAYLLDHPNGWDVTDGDAPWPPTKENLASLKVEGLTDRMLTACESAVGSFLAPNTGGNLSPG